MEEPRTCRKCGEPIPESRGPRAEDCGLPKCKSKAYRFQKKRAEAESLAAALAAKQTDEGESKSANGLAIPISNREPEQSPKPSAPFCKSVGAAPSVQEVRLQPGQQSIVLVCGCGARTTIQISHTTPEPIPVAIPLVTETTAEVSLPSSVSQPSVSDASETKLEVANPILEPVASPVTESVASPVPLPVASPSDRVLGVLATTPLPTAPEVAVEPPVALQSDVGAMNGGTKPAPLAVNDKKERVALSVVTRVSDTDSREATLHVAPPKPKFQVVELYFVRKKDGVVVTWEDAKTPGGFLLPGYESCLDWIGTRGFGFAALRSKERRRIEDAVTRGECQLKGLLIVSASRYGEHIVASTTGVDRLASLFGARWRRSFEPYLMPR